MWIKTETVAERQTIPLPFLLNILAELRTAGLVQSRRGAEGGYRLALPATEIRIADVIRVIDGPLANIAGERPEDVAYSGAAVALRDVWVAAGQDAGGARGHHAGRRQQRRPARRSGRAAGRRRRLAGSDLKLFQGVWRDREIRATTSSID